MRYLVLLLAGLVGTQAQASFFQTTCSNAKQTVEMHDGQMKNVLKIQEYKINKAGKPAIATLEFKLNELTISDVESKQMLTETVTTCKPGDVSGVAFSKTIDYRDVEITKNDSTQFSKSTTGVSADQKSVRTQLICEYNYNNKIKCP